MYLGAEEKKSLSSTLVLGALFGGWYLFNIYFNMCPPPPSRHPGPFLTSVYKKLLASVCKVSIC